MSERNDSEILEELVTAAAAGDVGAQEHLMQGYWAVIRQVVRARRQRTAMSLRAREETQDLEQSAALRVLEELGRHRWQGRSAFAAWVKRLAQVEVIDRQRYHGAGKRDARVEARGAEVSEMPAFLASGESRFDLNQELANLLDQVQQLKPEYGAALTMHHMGFSHHEVGESLGCSAEAARKLVARARSRLVKKRKG